MSSSSVQVEPSFNNPVRYLIDGDRRSYNEICVPLYNASIIGDWKAASKKLQNGDLVRYSITENLDTALHVAATAQSTTFVKHLVNMMTEEDLTLQNIHGDTALALAAIAGNIKMVKIMLEKNPKLVKIPGRQESTPVYLAALYGRGETVTYLYEKSRDMVSDDWIDEERIWLFLRYVEADLFDVALQIYNDFVGKLPDNNAYLCDALKTLAAKPHAFNQKRPHAIRRIIRSITYEKLGCSAKKGGEATQLLKKIWEKIMEKPKDEILKIVKGEYEIGNESGNKNGNENENENENVSEIKNIEEKNILFIAAKMGNCEFLDELIQKYPEVMWLRNDNNQTIFHIGVSHRHESIFNLIHHTGPMKDFIIPLSDNKGKNNMLHLVGMNQENEEISGAAFQMQRELLWNKEVCALFPQYYREKENGDGKKPAQLFTENHKHMLSEAEKWMKGTANQCLVVAALITTIVFAVAFTIPGGYNQNTGFPMFLQNGPFIAFVVLDAISLILSSASILVFLSILTSRYAQNDFLKTLPEMLIVGLATLFLSIVTMMLAFAISFFVLYRNKFIVIPCIISVVAVVPIYIYGKLLFPLLVDACRSTYGSTYRFKPKKGIFYHQNPRF